MTQRKWIGKALALALLSTAIAACSVSNSSNQSEGNAAAEQSGIALDSNAEQQIRDAIANAPSHGLKPDLFLKGGEKGEALSRPG